MSSIMRASLAQRFLFVTDTHDRNYSASLKESGNSDAVTRSMHLWMSINGEVIILAFLPGLLFLDSYNVDIHLFQKGFVQLGGQMLEKLCARLFFRSNKL